MFKSMKTGVLALILATTAIYAHAQKKISQGTVVYTLEYAPTAEQEAAVAQMPTEQKVAFNGALSKIVIEQGPATITVLHENISNTGLVLIDVPVAQMQFAVKQGKAEVEKAKALNPKLTDFKATGEKKMIGAYNAEKYTYKDDKGASYELWATTDVELPEDFAGDDFKGVKGTLLKFTRFQQGIKTNLTVKSITEEKQGPFNLDVPSGYEVKTMEEIMAMSGGGE